jgi:hypothetical protein
LSNYFLTLAFFTPDLPSSRKFVLVALADAANDHGVCYPSIAHIIAKTSLDRKTVIESLAYLHEKGLISKTGEMTGRTKQIPVLRMEFGKDTISGTLQTVPNFPANSPKFPSKQSQKRDTEPSVTVRKQAAEKDEICEAEILPSAWHDIAQAKGIPDEQIYKSWRKFKDHTSLPFRLNNWRGWIARERVTR